MKHTNSAELERLPGSSFLPLAGQTVDARMVALMRTLLGLSALCMVYIDPPASGRQLGIVYAALALYSVYSLAVCATVFHDRSLIPERPLYWADVVVYGFLVMLTGGVSSVFYHFFFFAILVASFSQGFREGLAATAASAVLFMAASFFAYSQEGALDVDRAVIRPIYLLILGYMISYWGGREMILRRRLALLKEMSTVAFPTFGVDHAVHEYLRRLLGYFNAKTCLMVLVDPQASKRWLYRAEAAQPYAIMRPEELTEGPASTLLALPPLMHATCDARASWPRGPHVVAWDGVDGRDGGGAQEKCIQLANLLECPLFATVPYKQPGGVVGRLFILSTKRRFGVTEVEFLAQLANQIAISVKNIMLLDALTHDAALQERSKISRDIHDSTVQSYIGLKLGLEALWRDVGPESPAAVRIKELLDMATLTVEDLRNYIDRLTGHYARRPSMNLLAGVLEQKRRYQDFHGLDVEVHCEEGLQLSDWVAGEAYQIVCEALSNVLRHTEAKRASVTLGAKDNALHIEVANEPRGPESTLPFVPRSISERAASLGGTVEIRLGDRGKDRISARIPLSTRPLER